MLGEVHLIDYEQSGLCFAAFDLGFYIVHSAGDYLDKYL